MIIPHIHPQLFGPLVFLLCVAFAIYATIQAMIFQQRAYKADRALRLETAQHEKASITQRREAA